MRIRIVFGSPTSVEGVKGVRIPYIYGQRNLVSNRNTFFFSAVTTPLLSLYKHVDVSAARKEQLVMIYTETACGSTDDAQHK